jgi:hypothetical protein
MREKSGRVYADVIVKKENNRRTQMIWFEREERAEVVSAGECRTGTLLLPYIEAFWMESTRVCYAYTLSTLPTLHKTYRV